LAHREQVPLQGCDDLIVWQVLGTGQEDEFGHLSPALGVVAAFDGFLPGILPLVRQKLPGLKLGQPMGGPLDLIAVMIGGRHALLLVKCPSVKQ